MQTTELIEYFEKKFNKKISKLSLKEWNLISQSENPYLSEDFIREFKDEVWWGTITINQKLSEEFIREFETKVDWGYVPMYQKLSESFIREFKKKFSWYWIFQSQKLSCEFIEEFKDRIGFSNLSKHNKINYLKYKLKSGKISQEEYLKELLSENKRIN